MSHSAPRRAGIPAIVAFALVVSMGGSDPLNSNRVWARPLADRMAPTISQMQAGSVTETAVVLTWVTDVAADSRVEILPPPDCPAGGCVTASAILTTAHSLVLNGLTAGTTYQLAVQSTDAAGNAASVAASVTTAAAELPPGFSKTAIVALHSFPVPTAMQFAPDGRLFVSQQTGQLRVIKAGALLPAPFMSLAVDSAGERGLLGVAFDPDFSNNQYVYANYTVPAGGGAPAHNRVSRFTADGDVAVPGSELVLMDLDNSTGSEHVGGAIDFGPDGKLYVAVGDNGISSNSQSMSTRFGKMLRINPDGTIPTDNPFYLTASGLNRAIWALGLRNPFTFARNPTGAAPRMLINDVGQETWEEVNEGIAGANFGWPATEGVTADSAYRSPLYSYGHHLILRDGVSAGGGTGVKMLWSGGSIYALGTAGGNWWKWVGSGWTNVGTTHPGGPLTPSSGTASPDGTIVPPAAQIVDADGAVWTMSGVGTASGCAITGGAFYNPESATFPAAYLGSYFFADFCEGWIKRFDPTLSPPSVIDFASGLSLPIDLKVGSDGSLYYLSRGQGTVFRVQYSNQDPTVLTHPANVTVPAGQPATFSVTAAGSAPLAYQWQRNEADIDGATSASYTLSTTTLADTGAQIRVRVSNGVGALFSNVAVLTVAAPPAVTITHVQAAWTTETAAELTWQTNVAADSRVEILPPPACPAGGCVTASASLTTAHSLVLSGLTAGTTYQLKVQSTDAAGNTASVAASVTTVVNLPTESPDATLVPPASRIVDAQGAEWTMSGGAILRNGASAAGGSGVKILWSGGSIYVLGSTGGNWWKWLGAGWTNVGPAQPGATVTPPPPSGPPSADGTLVPPETQIVDASGALWTMSGGAVLRNGASAAGGSGVKILWSGGSIYVLGSTGGSWWKWGGAGWTNVGPTQPGPTVTPPPLPPAGPPSGDGTLVPPETQIVDASGALWTMSGGAILRNGASAAGGSGVKILWSGGSIYVLSSTGGSWWKWLGAGWTNVGPTQPGPTVTPPPPPPSGPSSDDGTMVPPETQIVDASGALWTMSGGAILRNGASAAGGSGVKILWSGGSIYVLGSGGGSWWKWGGAGWTNVGPTQPGPTVTPPPPPPTGPSSGDGTMVPPETQIVDASGALWTISGGVILRNGASAAGGSGVKILWSGGSIYVLGSGGGSWWKWGGAGWTNVGPTQPGPAVTPPPPPPPGGPASSDGTVLPPAEQIVDAQSAVWTLSGQVVLRNGAPAAGGTGFKILWLRGTIYVLGSDGNRWWQWTGSGWTYFGMTQPT